MNLYQVSKAQPPTGGQTTSSEADLDATFIVEQIAGKVLVVDVRTSQGVTAGRPGGEERKCGTDQPNGQVEQVQI